MSTDTRKLKRHERALGVDRGNTFKSETEVRWHNEGEEVLERHLGLRTTSKLYEAVTFNVGGKFKYTPDFMHYLEDRTMVFVEVKTSRYAHGFASSQVRLKATAAEFQMFRFFLALATKEGFDLTEI